MKDLGKFVHGPPFTRFTLAGKHKALDCQKCHQPIQVAGATPAAELEYGELHSARFISDGFRSAWPA